MKSMILILSALSVFCSSGYCQEIKSVTLTDSDAYIDQKTIVNTKHVSAEIRKGPYLIYSGDNTEMTVLWQLNDTETCTLEWGFDTSYSEGSVFSDEYGIDHQHSKKITGLTPGAKYYYRVEVSGSYATGSFLAAPAADATDACFLAYGDTRSNPGDHDSVCSTIVSTYTLDTRFQTFLLHSGDWVYAGDSETDWETQYFNRSRSNILEMQANLPIQGCMGNHEQTGSLFVKYWPYPFISARYWSFDYGPAHIVVADQYSDYSSGSPQLTWIENELSTSTKEWKFLIFHEPGWSAGGHSNNTAVQTLLQPLCENYGVDIVFNGHNHYYARCEVNEVQHITTGGGGAPLYTPDPGYPYVVVTNQTLHFCKIDIQDNQLSFEAVKPDDTVIDTFIIIHTISDVHDWDKFD